MKIDVSDVVIPVIMGIQKVNYLTKIKLKKFRKEELGDDFRFYVF